VNKINSVRMLLVLNRFGMLAEKSKQL